MRKHISVQDKPENTILSLKKILIISLIFFLIASMMGVMASNGQLKNVKIVLSSGYEMNIMTSKSTVEEILKENNIVVLDEENVTPNLNEELSDNKTIIIQKGEKKVKGIASYFSEKEILESYKSIVEKIVTVQEDIPYETITKDVSNSGSQTQERIVQVGSNGIKEITYKVKYQNGEEIEREVISENIIKEPVAKIVEVRTRAISSRSGISTGSELETIWAIVRQEGGSSYESSLAVASSAVNRINSSRWSRNGSTIYAQLTAPGQYCYSIDRHWVKYLGGNVPEYVKLAVADAMGGKTNHPYTSFRSYRASTASQKASGVTIGGNVYFGN